MGLKELVTAAIEKPIFLDLIRFREQTIRHLDESDLDHKDLRKYLCNINFIARGIYRLGCAHGTVIASMIGAEYNPDYTLELGFSAAGAVAITFTLDKYLMKHFANPYQNLSFVKDD